MNIARAPPFVWHKQRAMNVAIVPSILWYKHTIHEYCQSSKVCGHILLTRAL